MKYHFSLHGHGMALLLDCFKVVHRIEDVKENPVQSCRVLIYGTK